MVKEKGFPIGRQSNRKGGTIPRGALRLDRASMTFYNLAADGKSHPRSFVFISALQPFEGFENTFYLLFVNADPVVPDVDLVKCRLFPAVLENGRNQVDTYARRSAFRPEFQSISDDILKQLDHLLLIRLNDRQVADRYLSLCLPETNLKIGHGRLYNLIEVDRLKETGLRGDAGIGQEGVNQLFHPVRCTLHTLQVITAFLIQ